MIPGAPRAEATPVGFAGRTGAADAEPWDYAQRREAHDLWDEVHGGWGDPRHPAPTEPTRSNESPGITAPGGRETDGTPARPRVASDDEPRPDEHARST